MRTVSAVSRGECFAGSSRRSTRRQPRPERTPTRRSDAFFRRPTPTIPRAVADDDDDDLPSSSSPPRLDFAWDPVPSPVGGAPLSRPPPPSPSPDLASAALAGLSSALRAVSSAMRLLLPYLYRKKNGDELKIIVPRPRDVARLTVAVVVAAAVLLGAVLLFDAVGERLVTATLGAVARKK